MTSPDPVIGQLRFNNARPTSRVIHSSFENLEEEIRKRDKFYTLDHVTQAGEVYTLFFCLREEYRKQDTGQQRKQD